MDAIIDWAACCPDCGASYPEFYSPAGSLGTFCDRCGFSSDESGDAP